MQRTILSIKRPTGLPNLTPTRLHLRTLATTAPGKPSGTIADSFASLSGQNFSPLDPRFAAIKASLIAGNESAVSASWTRLLHKLQDEVETIKQLGSSVIPQIEFEDVKKGNVGEGFRGEYRKRGVAVIKGVVGEEEAIEMKRELRGYIEKNPGTKSFNKQVYELYWSPTQIKARAHPNLLQTQRFLLSFWHSKDPNALFSDFPISYADRLRMREPGDAKFALGPHIDGGSCERWEQEGYGRGNVYKDIWEGNWEKYDAWESSCRLNVESDLYGGAGACSAFRAAQGWLSLSHTSAFQGTLLVNPLLELTTAYFLLRPFFTPTTTSATPSSPTYLSPENWKLESPSSSWLQGASEGHGQELSSILHPHLHLDETMLHIPPVKPGDYVVWHCDSIHAVDKTHAGKSDSSVLYIPTCPLTERNAEYLVRQRQCFERGVPSPDFPGGEGEKGHIGRAGKEDVERVGGKEGLRAMGLEGFSIGEGRTRGEREVFGVANRVLGFE